MAAEPASSEAENRYLVRGLTRGASSEAENRHLVRGLTGGNSSEGASGEAESWYLIRGLAVRASGESENRARPHGCLLALIFARSKQFFRFLLRVPLFMVSDKYNQTRLKKSYKYSNSSMRAKVISRIY